MEQNKTFVKKVQKLLYLKTEEEAKEFISRLSKFLQRNKHSNQGITPNLLGRGIALIMADIRQYEVINASHNVLKQVRHTCIFKHYEKIIEFIALGWGSQKITKYLTEVLKCEISRPTVKKVIDLIKEEEHKKEISKHIKERGHNG